MSHEATTWASQQVTGTPSRKAVLMNLADRAGYEWECWPSQATIARDTELSVRQVRRALTDLEAAGFITRGHRYGQGGGRTSDMITLTGHGVRNAAEGLPDMVSGGYRTSRPGGADMVSAKPSENHHSEPSLTLIPFGGVTEAASTSAMDDAFELFWVTYHRTGPKKVAHACWQSAVKKDSPDAIQAGLERWIAYWDSPDATKIKWPQGWLNEERWRDDPPVIRAGTRTAKERSWDSIQRLREGTL